MIVFLTFINARGVENGKFIQLIFTTAKIGALFALIVLGFAYAFKTDTLVNNFQHIWDASRTMVDENGNFVSAKPLVGFALLGAMGSTIINSLFSSDAWNNVTFIAGEIKDPKKNIPRSLLLGTLIVTLIYILANLAYLALLPVGVPGGTTVIENGIKFAQNDRVGAAAASVIFGGIGASIMAILIMVSTFGCNNGLILAGSRLFYAMSKDGLFFKKAGKINQFNVPGIALWIQCLWASALCLTGTYKDLIVFSTFASLLFYILTIAGLFVLRKKEPDTERPYKAFGYPFIPVIYIALTLFICVDLIIYDTKNSCISLIIIVLGLPIYFFNNKK